MTAYGRRRGDELETKPLGAPTRHQKMQSATRRAGRRILRKQARNDAKRELREAVS